MLLYSYIWYFCRSDTLEPWRCMAMQVFGFPSPAQPHKALGWLEANWAHPIVTNSRAGKARLGEEDHHHLHHLHHRHHHHHHCVQIEGQQEQHIYM